LIPAGLDCVIAGWGFSNRSHNITPAKLQALQVKIDGWNVCKRRWHGDIEHFHICAWVPIYIYSKAANVIGSSQGSIYQNYKEVLEETLLIMRSD